MGGEINIFTEKVTLKVESDIDAINSALQYCMAAIKALEMLKLSSALDIQKIEAMKKATPDINVFTEFTSEKPLPGSRGVNPLNLLKSDSQIN
jgi:ATP-dependent protease HslVU (ClpYQ) peptidase subunit